MKYHLQITYTGYTFGVNTYTKKVWYEDDDLEVKTEDELEKGFMNGDLSLEEELDDCDDVEVVTLLSVKKSKWDK